MMMQDTVKQSQVAFVRGTPAWSAATALAGTAMALAVIWAMQANDAATTAFSIAAPAF